MALVWTLPDAARGLDRRIFLAEQMTAPVRLNEAADRSFRLSADATHYGDIFSTLATVAARTRLIEVRVLAQRVFFGGFGETSREFRSALLQRGENAVGGEVAKVFFTHDRFYGRIGAGLLALLPGNSATLRFALETGTLPAADLPWLFRFGAYVLPGLKADSYLHLRAEVGHFFTGSLSLGGSLAWTHVLNGQPGDGVYDKTLFTLGPFVELGLGSSWLRLSLSLRAFLDSEIRNSTSGTPLVTSSSRLGPPDASLAWAVTL